MREQSESTRQQKVGRQIQKDLSEIFLRDCRETVQGTMVSVTSVRMSPDLGYAKVYVSVFPFERGAQVMEALERDARKIRKALGDRLRFQLRVVPAVSFFLDDSLEYVERIDSLLRQ